MKLRDLIQEKNILLSDGAWGTQIAGYGFAPGTCPELLNITEPEIIKSIATGYIAAGADIILTNTFGGSRWKLAKYSLEG